MKRRFLACALVLFALVSTSLSPARADVYFPPGMPSSAPSGNWTTSGPATIRCTYDDSYTYGSGTATAASSAPEGTVVLLPYTVREDFEASESRAPVCRSTVPGTGTRRWEGLRYCPTGYDVWRFYGYVPRDDRGGNPVMAMSVSRVNFDEWCRPFETTRPALFSPHPNDAGVNPSSPFQAVVQENTRGEDYARTEIVAGRRKYTTAPPSGARRRTGFGSCTSVTTGPGSPYGENPMADIWSDPASASYTQARNEFIANSDGWTQAGLGPRTVDVLGNMKPGTDPRSTYPGALAQGWDDGIPCSSGYEFAAYESSEYVPVFGVCALPTQRLASLWRDEDDKIWYGFETLARGGGDRWVIPGYHDGTSDSFPTFPDAALDSRLSGNDVVDGATWYHKSWRAAIKDEILRRAEIGVPGEEVPGAPYKDNVWDRSFSMNLETSANAARTYARCGNGEYQADLEPSPNPQPKLTVGLDHPAVFEVGGQQNPQEVAIKPTGFTCAGCQRYGAPAPYLVSVTGALSIAATNGYDQYKVVSLPDPGPSADTGRRAAVLWFYKATKINPTQKVVAELTNVSAKARVFMDRPERRPVYLNGAPLLDTSGRPVTYLYFPPRDIDVEVTLGTTRVDLPVVSGSADPTR